VITHSCVGNNVPDRKLRMIRVLIRVRDTSTPTWCDRPVEDRACLPTLIPCRSTINGRSLRRGLDDCHVVAFHVAALSNALPKSAQIGTVGTLQYKRYKIART